MICNILYRIGRFPGGDVTGLQNHASYYSDIVQTEENNKLFIMETVKTCVSFRENGRVPLKPGSRPVTYCSAWVSSNTACLHCVS